MSRIRHRSKTNSRNWEDLAFRREYVLNKGYCEMSPLIYKLLPELGLMRVETATDPHHLFGGAGRRVDCRLNLLAVCRPVHLWAHAHLKESRLVGIWLKVRDGLFEAELFHEISGKFIEGWLSLNEPETPEFVPLWTELIKAFP